MKTGRFAAHLEYPLIGLLALTSYTLHVWAWKENPNGTFVNWHPKVSCDEFTAQNP